MYHMHWMNGVDGAFSGSMGIANGDWKRRIDMKSVYILSTIANDDREASACYFVLLRYFVFTARPLPLLEVESIYYIHQG